MEHVIELFVADHCPGCHDARRRLHEFAGLGRNVLVIERNVEHHLETARRYGLFATPAMVIDGGPVLYGVPTVEQLAAQCTRGTAARPGGAASAADNQTDPV